MSPHSMEHTARGFAAPYNTQFSVFLDNRVGKLAELIDIFDGESVHIAALSVADSSDYSIVRLLTTNRTLSRNLLNEHKLPYTEAEILIVELSPRQTLTDLCRCLLAAEVSIHYAYPLLVRPHGAPPIALHTDDQVLACQILQRKLFNLLAEDDLSDDETPELPDYGVG